MADAVATTVSTHGLVIALLQFAFVLGLVALRSWWSRRRRRAGKPRDRTVPGILMLVLLLEYALLRWQPMRMGADPFEYTLGLFDAFTLSGLVLLGLLHEAGRPRPDTA